MSNSLDPDQARHFVRPGLGPSWLPRLSVDKRYLVNFEVDTWHSLLHEPPKVKSTCYVYIFKPAMTIAWDLIVTPICTFKCPYVHHTNDLLTLFICTSQQRLSFSKSVRPYVCHAHHGRQLSNWNSFDQSFMKLGHNVFMPHHF